MSKRKKQSTVSRPTAEPEENESVTPATAPPELLEQVMGGHAHDEPTAIASDPRPPLETEPDADLPEAAADSVPLSESIDVSLDSEEFDAEMTVNLVGDLPLPGRDDLDAPTVTAAGEAVEEVDPILVQREHLRGLLEALVFASDSPIKPSELAKLAHARQKEVTELLGELQHDYSTRGVHLDEVAGGWVFRTSPRYAPFVRDLTKQKPVRLTRAQLETLAIIAYRQPITRPEVDDVRGVDTGPVLKLLLERDLVRILGKRDEPGRPMIYGSTGHFLEFFGLKSLKDLPTLREFTELSDESRDTFEEELGESPEDAARLAVEAEARVTAGATEGTHDELGEHEDIQDRDDRAPHESMRVPVSEHALDEAADDDLEPVFEEDAEEAEEAEEPHAADDDGPTLTSEAPATNDD